MADDKSARIGPTGHVGLIELLNLAVPLPAVRSRIAASGRLTRIVDGIVDEHYPRGYAPKSKEEWVGHLKFALRYEPSDLGVLDAAFRALGRRAVEEWVRSEPLSAFARRAWYLFELLLAGETLDVPDVAPTGYVDLLDPELHFTAEPVRARRQRVNDNLPGSRGYCPMLRRTETLRTYMASGLADEARALIEGCDPGVLARAVNYLYTKETKSSFAIEGEAPSPERSQRFVDALAGAAAFDPMAPSAFVQLQNVIVDARYRESGWRTVQNFVGQTRSDFTEHVHFVCPKPEDVEPLMQGWMTAVRRLRSPAIDPVCAAAAASFGFVFIHPFEDGNGRIHRFLIHHMLAQMGFTPGEILLPVSAVIVRDRRAYDRVLSSYSSSIAPFIKYEFDADGRLGVGNQTATLYRFWDATPFAEYLFTQVEQAIRRDLREEIGFLQVFDESVRRVAAIVDMPDRRASLLTRLIVQNNGTLSQTKRGHFAEITASELAAIEDAVRTAMGGRQFAADREREQQP